MRLDWFLGQIHPQQPGLWLLFSLVLAAGQWLSVRWLTPALLPRVQVARWVLAPYLGLLLGGLSPRLLGLTDLDWLAGFGLGFGLVLVLWVLLILVRLTVDSAGAWSSGAGRVEARSLASLFIMAGAQEFHWVFLRGGVLETLLTLPEPPPLANYWAIWIATLFALLGVLFTRSSASQRFVSAFTLLMTSVLFFYARNFWLCWLLHASLRLLLAQEETSTSHLTRAS